MSTPINHNKIKISISKPRFKPYINAAGGNQQLAVKLYQYNAELAGSLFLPLNVTEITLRNAVNNAFTNQFGKKWYEEEDFYWQINPDTKAKLKSLIGALIKKNMYNQNQVVAKLSLGFWIAAFDENRQGFWRDNVNNTFPNWKENFPNAKTKDMRSKIKKIAKPIHRLRNQIAHHEIILNKDVRKTHQNMIQLTTLKCEETAKWMEQNSKVNEVLDNDPRQ